MCLYQGTEQGDAQRGVTANPRRLTVNAVNYPEWNPGERLIIWNGFGGAVHGTGLLLIPDAGCEALCAFVPRSGATLLASPPPESQYRLVPAGQQPARRRPD
jgi:hypothetical protein